MTESWQIHGRFTAEVRAMATETGIIRELALSLEMERSWSPTAERRIMGVHQIPAAIGLAGPTVQGELDSIQPPRPSLRKTAGRHPAPRTPTRYSRTSRSAWPPSTSSTRSPIQRECPKRLRHPLGLASGSDTDRAVVSRFQTDRNSGPPSAAR